MDERKQETLIKAFGNYGAESIILACRPGHILWTDDFAMAKFARQEFGARRAWTQVALASRLEAGSLDSEAYFDASARLLGWGYTVTRWNAFVLLRAGSIASWRPEAWPLEQALSRFSDDFNALPELLSVAYFFLSLSYKEILIPELRKTITDSVLEHLAKRKEGLLSVRALLRSLQQTLANNQAVDIEHNRLLIADIKAWLDLRERGIQIL